MLTPEQLRLIVITDEKLAAPRSVSNIVQAAVDAGAPAIQLRSKDATAREAAELGQRLREITTCAGALLFVNDRFDVALSIGADGVHVGPDDLPVAAVRRTAPAGFLIGTSTDDPGEAVRLVAQGADYIGCGTVYPTRTKRDAGQSIGLDGLSAVVAAVEVPVVGIGGIDERAARAVAQHTGAAGVATVSAVMRAEDPARTVSSLLHPFEKRR